MIMYDIFQCNVDTKQCPQTEIRVVVHRRYNQTRIITQRMQSFKYYFQLGICCASDNRNSTPLNVVVNLQFTPSQETTTMKLNLFSVVASAILAATADASPVAEQDAQAGCTLSGTYSNSNSLTSCSTVVISSFTVPAGVTLDLTNLKDGATVSLTGLAPSCGKSTLTGFTLKNSPFRTFSVLSSVNTQLTGLTLDSKAGDGLIKNTDGFDLSRNTGVSITQNTIYQDDCLAMQSSTNTLFAFNSCTGGHAGLTVNNNNIINSANGLRIKTIIGLKGLVSGMTYTNNTLSNVKNAIVVRSRDQDVI
ncbi:hypothetical protein LEN26_002163 [Aphanomyces euteiches]|nr:hypothetical protein LEN26_002163 [Aphanomyces euteiches]